MRSTRTPAERSRRGFSLLLMLAVAGCVSVRSMPQGGRWRQADYHLSYGLPFLDREALRAPLQPAPSEGGLEEVSARIWLVSDNQRHELLGSNISGIRMAIADEKFAESAIRPPQLDLFGQGLLREALDRTDGFVLHLGDACDISNSVEFALFAWDMQRARSGWLMTPGNHDGYFMGNTSRVSDEWVRRWDETAEAYDEDGVRIASRAMQKDDYLAYYLAAIILENAAWSASLARHLGAECAAIHERWVAVASPTFARYWEHLEALQAAVYRVAADGATHRVELRTESPSPAGVTLRRLAWAVDLAHPWKSYLVQEVDIGLEGERLSLLVLDTAQYAYRPSAEYGLLTAAFAAARLTDVQLAGTHGNILPTQLASLEWLMERMTAERRRWMCAVHHPFEDLGRHSWSRFNEIRAAGGIPVALSAHTHDGEYRWHHDGRREGAWLELNVGSMLDAPVEYRNLQVHRVGDRLAVHSRRFLMEEVLRADGLLASDAPGHRPGPGDPDDYMNYRLGWNVSAAASELAIKRVLLAAYLRMFRLFPTKDGEAAGASWPVRLDGTPLRSHADVLAEIERMTAQPKDAVRVPELVHLLYELRDYDRTRTVPAADRQALRRYRLSQAIWAGRAELEVRGVRPYAVDPDISFVLLPAGTAAARD